jgi:hypothetical protein
MSFFVSPKCSFKKYFRSSVFISFCFLGVFFSNNLKAASTILSSNGGEIIIDQTTISGYTWPVTIINSNPSSTLTITLSTGINLNSVNQYFIIRSDKITFDGNAKQVVIDNVTNYQGLFQNGTSSINGYNDIVIKNFTISTSGSSTLANSGGWLCQSYFRNGTILNSYSTGSISGTYTGGLIGSYSNYMSATNCYSTGIISGGRAAGIFGAFGSYNTAINCYSYGLISGLHSGGIYGSHASNSLAKNCYSFGNITGFGSGGIFGDLTGDCLAFSSFSFGSISGSGSGGIYGSDASNSTANTCYSKGNINNNGGGIYGSNSSGCAANYCYASGTIGSAAGGIFGSSSSNASVSNCYTSGNIDINGSGIVGPSSSNSTVVASISSNGTWSDVSALTTLSGATTYNTGITQAWTSLNVNTPFALTYFLTPNTSVTLPTAGVYQFGTNLDLIVNYDKAITVNTTGGTPRLVLNIGGQTQYANYLSGSGTSALTFRYTVSNLDNDNDGIAVTDLSYNGGDMTDVDGFNVAMTLNGISTNVVKIDHITTPITINSPSLSAYVSNVLPLSFIVPESITPGTLTMSLISSTFSVTYQMSDRATGAYNLNLNSKSNFLITNPTNFLSSTPTGITSIPAGTYTLTMRYRDLLSNPTASTSVSGIIFKYTTTPPVLTYPVAATKISNRLLFKYDISDAPFSGSKRILISKNNAVVTTITLLDNDNDTISFDLHHIASSGGNRITSVVGLDSLSDGDYTCTFSYQDFLGNPVSVVSSSFIKDASTLIGVLSHQNNIIYGPFTETLTFNKAVDIISSNPILPNSINNNPSASIGALQPNSDRTIFTFSVTPLQQGWIKLQAPNRGVAIDYHGNLSQVITIDSVQYVDTTIRVNPIVTGVLSYCEGDSTILTSSTANTYLWSTGATTKSIVVKQAGTYNVKTTYDNFIRGTSSDLIVTVNPNPAKPSISRDLNNNLVSSSSYGNTWYEGGTALKDTAAIFKPAKAGVYSVKTVQLGCVSSLSTDYFYVLTDIVNLSNNEFIKLVPNPFTNKVNFDFILKGYPKLDLEIIDFSTGYKVGIMQGLLPGNVLNLGHLKPGMYVFKVSSADNKIVHQFKMVKL